LGNGFSCESRVSLAIRLPSGFRPEAAPDPIEDETEVDSFQNGCAVRGNVLHYVRWVRIDQRLIRSDDFSALGELRLVVSSNDESSFSFRN
jgi:hypothetical protein